MTMGLNDLHTGRAFDQLDFIAIRGVDEDKPAAGGSLRRTIGDLDPLRIERCDCLVETFDLKGKMDEILLDCYRPTGREAGQLDEFVTVGDL